MKKTSKGIKILTAIYLAIIISIIAATAVHGSMPEPTLEVNCHHKSKHKNKELHGLIEKDKHIYIYDHGRKMTGWVNYKGHRYYLHKTGSKKYPVGSATRGEMRIRNGNKWYAMDGNGQMVTEDYYVRKGRLKKRLCVKLRKDKTVQFIYNTSACFGYIRYSTSLKRYQESDMYDRWNTVGMQCFPDYVDHQR